MSVAKPVVPEPDGIWILVGGLQCWKSGDREPHQLLYVVDRDGELWAPTGRGAWFGFETTAVTWGELLDLYGPVTEVPLWYTSAARVVTEVRSIYAAPRRFADPQPEPTQLKFVTDKDGYRWATAGNGGWFGIETTPLSWNALLVEHGPLTEVANWDRGNWPADYWPINDNEPRTV